MVSNNREVVQQQHHVSSKEKHEPIRGKSPQHGSLLFVNRTQASITGGRSTAESEEIKQHLARRHLRKRRVQQKLELHPSINRILTSSSSSDEVNELLLLDSSGALDQSDVESTVIEDQHVNSTTRLMYHGALDPFSPSVDMNFDIRRLLFLYCQNLQPLARVVSPDWNWIGSLGEIQASPLLTYAIAAYAAAFSGGLRSGSKGLALPPVPEKGRTLLWSIPLWFQLQSKATALLNEALSDKTRCYDNDVYHTIIFMFRLSALFGDGVSARIHYKALKEVARIQTKPVRDISLELGVTKVNYITLYLYKASLVKQRLPAGTEYCPDYNIIPDESCWKDKREWNKFQGMLYTRSLTWQARPGGHIHEESTRNIRRVDINATMLAESTMGSLTRTYQVALYLLSYLINISFDNSLAKIQLHLDEITNFTKSTDFESCYNATPRTLFLILFVGAFTSRGLPQRKWYISKLAGGSVHIKYMSDLYTELDEHLDAVHIMPVLLEEVLAEIRHQREGRTSLKRAELYNGVLYRPNRYDTPMDCSPDLTIPVRVKFDADLEMSNMMVCCYRC